MKKSIIKIENINKIRIDLFYNKINNLIIKNNIKSIVEIGCGEAYLAEKIMKTYKDELILVDIKDQRKVLKENKFLSADCSIDKLNIKSESIDLIIATQVIEHMENPTFFYKETCRILKSGGFLILSYPNFSNIFQRIIFFLTGNVGRLGGKLGSGGHINFVTEKYLQHFLSEKFELISSDGDVMAWTDRAPKFFNKFNRNINEDHIIFESINSSIFSYNVNTIFKKID